MKREARTVCIASMSGTSLSTDTGDRGKNSFQQNLTRYFGLKILL